MDAMRTIAALPEDRWGEEHWDSLVSAQAVIREELARWDRLEDRKVAAAAERRARVAPKKKARRDPPELVASRRIVAERSEGYCEHPDGCAERATHVHHKAGRVGRGVHAPEMLLALCEAHHVHVHAHPEESFANGTLIHRGTVTLKGVLR